MSSWSVSDKVQISQLMYFNGAFNWKPKRGPRAEDFCALTSKSICSISTSNFSVIWELVRNAKFGPRQIILDGTLWGWGSVVWFNSFSRGFCCTQQLKSFSSILTSWWKEEKEETGISFSIYSVPGILLGDPVAASGFEPKSIQLQRPCAHSIQSDFLLKICIKYF